MGVGVRSCCGSTRDWAAFTGSGPACEECGILFGARYHGAMNAPVGRTPPLVVTGLLGAMALVLAHQGLTNRFWPSLLGAGLFLAGGLYALRRALKRPRDQDPTRREALIGPRADREDVDPC